MANCQLLTVDCNSSIFQIKLKLMSFSLLKDRTCLPTCHMHVCMSINCFVKMV